MLSSSISGQDSSYFSPEARIRFADHLYCSGDFFRAGLEYHEAFKTSGDSLPLLKWILSEWRADNIARITTAVEQLSNKDVKSISSAFIYGLLISGFSLKLPNPALSQRIETLASSSEHQSVSIIKNSSSFIYSLQSEIPGGLDEEAKQDIISLKIKYQNLPYKSPLLAGLFSAILPGSGKIYTGETGDGVTAFILTSLFSYLAYTGFDHDHMTRGYLLGAAAAGFYLGNIYGSVISARLRNEKTLFDMKSEFGNFLLKNNWFLGFSLELPCDS